MGGRGGLLTVMAPVASYYQDSVFERRLMLVPHTQTGSRFHDFGSSELPGPSPPGPLGPVAW